VQINFSKLNVTASESAVVARVRKHANKTIRNLIGTRKQKINMDIHHSIVSVVKDLEPVPAVFSV
jgi:hypothetical protein